MPSKKPRISLCMMVRDEAELLPGCFEAARGVWDELVVVDTGSKDATVAIAQQEGAKVVPFTWCDDFAAARNAGLQAATGEWILVLDADELLSAPLKEQLFSIANDPAVGAATVVMRNQLPHGHRREGRLLRFFRSDSSVRFVHRIHEDASHAVDAALRRSGQRLEALSGHVDHLGYQRARMAAKGKRERDQRLLERSLAEDPDDLYAWFKLLEQGSFWEDDPLQMRAAAGALDAMKRCDPARLSELHFGGDLVAAVAAARGLDAPSAGLQIIDEHGHRVRASAALHLKSGELRELLGDLPAARASYVACLAFHDAPGDLQRATVRPLLGLARLSLAAGDLPTASMHVRHALAVNPIDLEGLTAALLLARGGDVALEAVLAARGASAELRAAMGELALADGLTTEAVSAFEEAARSGDVRLRLRLAQALLADGRVEQARVLAEHLTLALPEAGLGVLVCDLIEGVASNLELDLSQRQADRALQEWVRVLRHQRNAPLLARLRAVAPAVSGMFPWLPEFVSTPAQVR